MPSRAGFAPRPSAAASTRAPRRAGAPSRPRRSSSPGRSSFASTRTCSLRLRPLRRHEPGVGAGERPRRSPRTPASSYPCLRAMGTKARGSPARAARLRHRFEREHIEHLADRSATRAIRRRSRPSAGSRSNIREVEAAGDSRRARPTRACRYPMLTIPEQRELVVDERVVVTRRSPSRVEAGKGAVVGLMCDGAHCFWKKLTCPASRRGSASS